MRYDTKDFISTIKSLSYPESEKSELTTRLLYASYKGTSNDINSKIVNSITESNDKVKEAYTSIDDPYLSKKYLRELCNNCIDNFRSGSYINLELYKLAIKFLKLKPSDRLLHVNAIDESFLLEASNSIKTGPLKLQTYAIPDNDNASEIIRMRLEMNEANYMYIDDINKITKFKPNKILINPVYSVIDKSYKFSVKPNTFWNDLLTITDTMTNDSRIIAIVPNVMLSNSVDKDKKERLLKHDYLEGIISLPLRYYSNSLKVEVSLLVFSKANKKIKILDINSIFTVEDVKFADLGNITEYIFERYNDDFNEVNSDDLIRKNSNLLISNIITTETYKGMSDLIELSLIADVRKGTKKTKVDFKDLIDQTGESSYTLLSSNDIYDGIIDYDRLTRIIYNPSLDKYLVKNGDVVITNKSSKPKLAVVDCQELKIIPTGSMIIISPHENVLEGNYLKMFFESDKGTMLLSKVQRGQATTTLYPKDIEKLLVTCIDYNDQLKLVKMYKTKLNDLALKKEELEKIKIEINELKNYGGNNNDNE